MSDKMVCCHECKFWITDYPEKFAEEGSCVRYPPRPVIGGHIFPKTGRHTYCGESKLKEDE